jgi:hypothetical protein
MDLRMALVLVSLSLAGCPRETESPMYGGQPVRERLTTDQERPAPADRDTPPPPGRGGTPQGTMEGATQPDRTDVTAPPEDR